LNSFVRQHVLSLFYCLIQDSEPADDSAPGNRKSPKMGDIEDLPGVGARKSVQPTITVSKRKRTDTTDMNVGKSWREALGRPPQMGSSQVLTFKVFTNVEYYYAQR
jgi:hypothetical protein